MWPSAFLAPTTSREDQGSSVRKRCAPPHLSAYSIVSLHQHGLRDMYFIGLQLDTVAIYFVAPTAPAWPQGTIQVGPFFPRRVVLRSQDRGTVCARCCWGFISEARNWSSVAYAPARTHISVYTCINLYVPICPLVPIPITRCTQPLPFSHLQCLFLTVSNLAVII